jgi:hypothetical protein
MLLLNQFLISFLKKKAINIFIIFFLIINNFSFINKSFFFFINYFFFFLKINIYLVIGVIKIMI